MLKNVITVFLIIFISAIVIILGGAVYMGQKVATPITASSTTTHNLTPSVQINANKTITANDVGAHNKPSDCWVIISNKVYNITDYIPLHPSGPNKIIPYCGNDATTAFNTMNGKGPHSLQAQAILDTYYVGSFTR